jgi:radical SAM superfamily enzyme YgiQ (UPF0313 family)
MKIKYYLPLIFFVIVETLGSSNYTHWNFPLIAGFLFFVAGFTVTYIHMIREIINNKDAVIKIGVKSPFLVPFFLFTLPTIISTAVFIPKEIETVIQFTSSFLFCSVIYFFGAFLLIRSLKIICIQKKGDTVCPAVKKKKLILINPVNSGRTGLSVNNSSIFPPAGLGIIASLTPDHYEVILIDENVEPFKYIKGDIAAVTCFTPTASRAYEISQLYKKDNIPVVIGGIHASMMPEEALQYADSVVIGEAESVWVQLLNDFECGILKETYKGSPSDMKSLPVPKRELFSHKYLFSTVQTSRGCPMDCYFCSVTPFNGRKFRQRPVGDVLKEIEQLDHKFIFFVDDNILGYGKESEMRAIELFKGLAERKLNKNWFCQSSLNFSQNEEVLYWASKSGCKMVFIGLESADPEELKLMNKKVNLINEYQEAFKRIHKFGIAVLGAFIFGSDCETVESMKRKTKYILKSNIDAVQTTILTPLPGTRLIEKYKAESRLKYVNYPDDWDKYDMSELTYYLKNIPDDKFVYILEKHVSKIYSISAVYLRFLKTLITTKSFTSAFFALGSNMSYRNVGIKKVYNCREAK